MSPRPVPLPTLQHDAYCPRQCAFIHNERVWEDNMLIARGRPLHRYVD